MSWHETMAVGSSYLETDETITHQIVDRPNMEKQFLSRWVLHLEAYADVLDRVNNWSST